MKHDDASEIERDAYWGDASGAWTVLPPPSSAEPRREPQPRAVIWSRVGRSSLTGKHAALLSIHVDDAALDEQCHATLRKLVAAGCTRAGVPYSLEQFQIAEQELQHLKRHGFVHAPASSLLHPVIRSYERQRSGADVGKITVVLNVNLYRLPAKR